MFAEQDIRLDRGAEDQGQPRLHEVEELVRQHEPVVGGARRQHEDAHVVGVEHARQVGGRHRVVHVHAVRLGGQGDERVPVAVAAARLHQVEVEGEAVVKAFGGLDQGFDAPPWNGAAAVHQADAPLLHRGRRQVLEPDGVPHDARLHAELLLVELRDRAVDRRHDRRARQVPGADPGHERGHEETPGQHVGAFLRSPFVHIAPDRCALGDPMRQRKRPRLVGDNQVELPPREQFQRALHRRGVQHDRAVGPDRELEHAQRRLGQGWQRGVHFEVLGDAGRGLAVPDRRDRTEVLPHLQLPKHAGIRPEIRERNAEDAGWSGHPAHPMPPPDQLRT